MLTDCKIKGEKEREKFDRERACWWYWITVHRKVCNFYSIRTCTFNWSHGTTHISHYYYCCWVFAAVFFFQVSFCLVLLVFVSFSKSFTVQYDGVGFFSSAFVLAEFGRCIEFWILCLNRSKSETFTWWEFCLFIFSFSFNSKYTHGHIELELSHSNCILSLVHWIGNQSRMERQKAGRSN